MLVSVKSRLNGAKPRSDMGGKTFFKRANEYVQWKYECNRTHQAGFSQAQRLLVKDEPDGDMLKAAKKISNIKSFLSPRIWRFAPFPTLVGQIKDFLLYWSNMQLNSRLVWQQNQNVILVSAIFFRITGTWLRMPLLFRVQLLLEFLTMAHVHFAFSIWLLQVFFKSTKRSDSSALWRFYNLDTLMSDFAFCAPLVEKSGLAIFFFAIQDSRFGTGATWCDQVFQWWSSALTISQKEKTSTESQWSRSRTERIGQAAVYLIKACFIFSTKKKLTTI